MVVLPPATVGFSACTIPYALGCHGPNASYEVRISLTFQLHLRSTTLRNQKMIGLSHSMLQLAKYLTRGDFSITKRVREPEFVLTFPECLNYRSYPLVLSSVI